MAQGPIAALQSTPVPAMASGISTATLTEEEKHQIEECERIIRFRDEILAGGHPRIKVPAHLYASKHSSESQSPSSSSVAVSFGPTASINNAPTGPRLSSAKAASPTNGPQVASNLRSFNANAQLSAPATSSTSARPQGLEPPSISSSTVSSIPTGPRATAGQRFSDNMGNVQFDPVLLTKSDDLIKAELQLQRQRLERALSDQLQQHRAASKPAQHADALVDFDLADVLMKALQLVQSSAPPQTDTHLAANASGADSDSADDDTFYSSKHDTPESHLTHRIPEPDESDSAQAREDSHYEPPMVIEASPIPGQPPVVAMTPSAVTSANSTQHQQHRDPYASVPSAGITTTYPGGVQGHGGMVEGQDATVPMEIISSQDSEEASSPRDSGLVYGSQPSAQRRLEPVAQQLIEHAFGYHQSPILRAHNLSPLAPQPAHVSPLATSHQPSVSQHNAPPAQATPAQVAALRNDRSNGSSPESSPQGKPNKKGKKNKKRKAERMANTVPSPYIKPEPRSPSPLSAPQYPRPNKRPRQVQRSGQNQGYDEAQVEEVVESPHQPSYPTRFYRDDRGPVYDSPNGHHIRQDSRPIVLTESPRYEREYRDELRPVETIRYVRRVSPAADLYQYSPSDVRTIRSVSHAAVERPYPYHDIREPPRAVVRPAADRDRSRSPIMVDERAPTIMGPPRLPTSRVVMDEFGREYIDPSSRPEPVIIRRSIAPRPVYGERDEYYDPSRTTARVIRRSVAPASIHGEPEIVYERAPPPRAASTMPGQSRYDEEVVYRRPVSPSAGYSTTRRVVTRPEYAVPEYRYYRERDYPPQAPSQTGGEYYEMRSTHPQVDEPPREYIVRSTTVRPEVSSRPEVIRLSSVRPEPVPGEYGAPIHPDDRQAMPPPRAYSARPMAAPPPQSQYTRQWPEYETRPGYGEPEIRGDDGGVTYIESTQREAYR